MGNVTSAPVPGSQGSPTESRRLRAEAPDSVPGPAAVLRLLGSARRADVAEALDALRPEQLAGAVAAVELPLAPAVVAHLSEHGPASARRTLARRLVEQPELVPQRPLTLEAYLRDLTQAAAADYRNGALTRLRSLALEAICGGTMTAEQVVEHTRPAALTLALAGCAPADRLRPWVRRATGDIRVLLADHLAEALAEDYERWARVITVSDTFGGTVAELLRRDDVPAQAQQLSRETPSAHAPQNVLLALAPPAIAARHLIDLGESRDARGAGEPVPQWQRLLSSGPLSRPLIDHVMAHGTDNQVRWLVGNELAPDSVLEWALPRHASDVLSRRVASAHLRSRAFRALDPGPRQTRTQLRLFVRSAPREQLIDLVWSLTDAPDLLHDLAHALRSGPMDQPTLTGLYGALAEAAGPEPVWALELRRAGTLARAMPQVRASLAACSAEPLLEAARGPRRHWIDALDERGFGCQLLRTEAELDRTGHLPLEALVAARLDGRPDRWRAVARRLAAGDGPVESVIAEVARMEVAQMAHESDQAGESAARPAPLASTT